MRHPKHQDPKPDSNPGPDPKPLIVLDSDPYIVNIDISIPGSKLFNAYSSTLQF